MDIIFLCEFFTEKDRIFFFEVFIPFNVGYKQNRIKA